MLKGYLMDLRQAARSLARAPGFTTVAVLTLGVGLGLATAIYAALKHVVIDSLPLADADRLIVLVSDVPGSGTDDSWGASTAQFFHFRDNAKLLDEIGVLQGATMNAEADGAEMRLSVALATAAAQRMTTHRAIIGRTLSDSDDVPGAPSMAVLGEGFWRSQFGADPDVVGRKMRFDTGEEPRVVEVVGVVAATGTVFDDMDVWLPMQPDPAGPHYNQHSLFVMAKRQAGVSLEAAQAEIDGLTSQLADAYPSVYGILELNDGAKVDFMAQFGFRSRWIPLKDYLVGGASAPLWIAQGAIVLLLVVAWVAIAHLFLARVEALTPEMAVRTALGAGRGAIVRQLAWACTLIAVGAWVAGAGLAWWLAATWTAVAPIDVPGGQDVGITGGVLASTAGVALLVAVSMVGTALMRLRGVAGQLTDAGRRATSSRARQRARAALVVTQVALAFVLLVGAGLLLSSFRNLAVTDPGIDPHGVAKITLVPDRAVGNAWDLRLQELQDAVAALPSVAVAGASTSVPFERGFVGCTAQFFEDPAVTARLNASNLSICGAQDYVTPGYFTAAGIPLLQGRTPTVADFNDPGVRGAVVSRSFAEKFFPGTSAVGKRLAPHGWDWFTIIGVVGDIYATSVAEPPTPHVYYPLNGIPDDAGRDPLTMTLLVRTDLAEPTAILPTLRRQAEALGDDVAITDAGTLADVVEGSMGRDRFMALLLGFSGGAALLLAVVGLYGVVRYLVARRTHEIGVRMAVGALPEGVQRMMVLASLKLVAAGLAVGLALSFGLSGVLRGLLFGVSPTSPAVYLACAIAFTCAAALASWAAARRAARITPMDALRVE